MRRRNAGTVRVNITARLFSLTRLWFGNHGTLKGKCSSATEICQNTLALYVRPGREIGIGRLGADDVNIRRRRVVKFNIRMRGALIVGPLSSLYSLLYRNCTCTRELQTVNYRYVFQKGYERRMNYPITKVGISNDNGDVMRSFYVGRAITRQGVQPRFVLYHFRLVHVHEVDARTAVIHSFSARLREMTFLSTCVLRVINVNFMDHVMSSA